MSKERERGREKIKPEGKKRTEAESPFSCTQAPAQQTNIRKRHTMLIQNHQIEDKKVAVVTEAERGEGGRARELQCRHVQVHTQWTEREK